MALLSIQNAGKQFGGTTLFSGVSFEVDSHDKWGLVGSNGCGKTTLFRLITGEFSPDEGQVVFAKETVLGYMEQHTGNGNNATLWEATESIFEPLKAMERELESLTEQLSEGTEEVIARHHALRETFEAAGGLYYSGRVRSTLLGLGFTETDFSLPLTALSGGQRSKAAMARLLLSGANLLLLDEPTNHLDIAAVEWLEDFLRNYTGAVIVISHDRYFLDRVTSRTLELSGGTAYITNGNYSTHREKREKEKEVAAKHYKTALQEIKHIEKSIELLHSFNREKSVRAAESKEKLLEKKKQAVIAPEQEEGEIRFDFSVEITGGNEVLNAGELAMSFGNTSLFSGVDLRVMRGDRLFLLGPNGCGKTTLLKILSEQLSPTEGFVRLGASVSIGYYDQTQAGLTENHTVLEEIWESYPRLTQTQVRSALSAFLFKGESVFAPIHTLSGGERARVLLLKLMLARNNFLLLDEPTNHLDIASREALETALEGYNGTVLVVSHDRYFINRLASKVLHLTQNGCEEFHGDYDTYLAQLQEQAKPVLKESVPKENDYKRRKELESMRRKLATQIRRAEEEIARLETEGNALRAQLEQPEIAADYEKLTELSHALQQNETDLETKMTEWETLLSKQEEENTL